MIHASDFYSFNADIPKHCRNVGQRTARTVNCRFFLFFVVAQKLWSRRSRVNFANILIVSFNLKACIVTNESRGFVVSFKFEKDFWIWDSRLCYEFSSQSIYHNRWNNKKKIKKIYKMAKAEILKHCKNFKFRKFRKDSKRPKN